MTKKTVTIERTYRAPIADVWELWTTKDGIEEWWGPDGFAVTVQSLDLRPGGELHYTMTAMRPEMIDFMKKNGMPTSTKSRSPRSSPTSASARVELEETPAGTKLTLTFDAMHDDVWTQRAKMGWESELDKLGKALAA